jgi:hypothetical protein
VGQGESYGISSDPELDPRALLALLEQFSGKS